VAFIGIRREDKSRWEARVPLVPEDVRRLVADTGVRLRIQASPIRAFSDDAYRQAGAEIVQDLGDCPVVMGVKEIPPERLQPKRTYVYFSHTIKGQPANMPALKRLMDLECNLIDYERITDDQNRRLVFFGRFAGLAGMIDTLWAFGQRLDTEGIQNPFSRIRPAHQYEDLSHAERELRAVADAIRREGLPEPIRPLVCGFAGYGQVSQGAQQVFDWLPTQEIAPSNLASVPPQPDVCYKVVFKEEDLVSRIDSSQPFDLQEYYTRPERYQAAFLPHAEHLTILVNCIYWEPKYPKLITRDQFRSLYGGAKPPRLRVIGDITCDVDGSIECTVRSTTPDAPVYVYDPAAGTTRDGVTGPGPVVLAVDFLPCELPVDASRFFSESLRGFIPALAEADLTKPLPDSGLPPELQRATIVYQGVLTEPYQYLAEFVQ
jgi:alpha-aminoadipic semialdehyde synthase